MALIGGNKEAKSGAANPATNRRNRPNGRDDQSASEVTFADDPLDPMLDVKKRARRRLIGAVAIVLGAIVFVPMIFDSGTKPVVDNISIQIPEKNTPFEPAAPLKQAAPVAPPAEIPAEPASPVVARAVNANAVVGSVAAATTPAANPVEKGPDKLAEKPTDKPLEKNSDKPVVNKALPEVSKPADDPRAVALLEGKTVNASNPDVKPEEKAQSFAVQIGAFSDPAKVKSLREKLTEGGFKTYTESVKTAQGERTRLRVGPYPSRAEADKAQERVHKLFVLDATIVPL